MPNTKSPLAHHLIAWRPILCWIAAKIDTKNWAVLRILYIAYCLADTQGSTTNIPASRPFRLALRWN